MSVTLNGGERQPQYRRLKDLANLPTCGMSTCGEILRRSQRDSRWSTRRKARRHKKLQNLCSGDRLFRVKHS